MKADQQTLNDSILRIDTLCKSLCGNRIYCLTITNDIQTEYLSREEEIEKFRVFEYEKGGCLKTAMREMKLKKRPSKKEKDSGGTGSITVSTSATSANGTAPNTVSTKKKKAHIIKKGSSASGPTDFTN